MNWAAVFNRLFELIDSSGTSNYFSGGRYLGKVREFDPYFPTYQQFIEQRRAEGKSTSRKDYYYDIFMSLPELQRREFVNSILNDLDDTVANTVEELRSILVGSIPGPIATVPQDSWNAERLQKYLQRVDSCVSAREYERAVSLAYTCLEGFYKAFVVRHIPAAAAETEIIALSKAIKKFLQDTLAVYPEEAISMITHISHTVDRARNRFSEAHFDEDAAHWLAAFVRDLVNTQIRLLLNFF